MKIPLTQQCSPFSGHSSPVHQFSPLSNYRVLQKKCIPHIVDCFTKESKFVFLSFSFDVIIIVVIGLIHGIYF